eukprot:1254962-Rhodomonas_salina.1
MLPFMEAMLIFMEAGGWGTAGCLQCAYHGWEFGSDGSCQKVPKRYLGRGYLAGTSERDGGTG